jgi:hypothetical protein
MPLKQVVQILGCRYLTMQQYLLRYRRLGWHLRRYKPKKFLALLPIKDQLLSRELLDEWKHLSLVDRVWEISERFRVVTNRVTLSQFYKAHGVKRLRPFWNYPRSKSSSQLQEERLNFVTELLKCFQEDREVLFFDETSIHPWMRRKSLWQHPEHRMVISLNPKHRHNTTIYGAISSSSKELHWQISQSTNTEDCLEFF